MIEIRDVSKRFGKLQVLTRLNVLFQANQSTALIGPNGCGKTTMIKSILSMVIPDEGDIWVNGQSVKVTERYRSQIGYMPQIGRYPDNMRIGQVIDTVRSLRKEETKFDDQLMQEYRIDQLKDKRMSTLSGGTRQKVSAMLAFMFDPEALILDEPTAGLDPLASEILKEKIKQERAKGKLILITSHLLAEMEELISHVVLMHEGKLRFHLEIEQLKSNTGEATLAKAMAKVIRQQGIE